MRDIDNLDALAGRHFTPAELAESWKVDETTIRRIFIEQPGVLKLGRQLPGRKRRSYVTLRIPAHVAARVYLERSK
jgi:hypothetical protein